MTAFTYLFRVPLHEVDHAGIVFFAHLFTRAHDAWEAFLREVGLDIATVIKDRTYTIPVVHAEADYIQPLRHGDTISIELRVKKPGNSSMRIQHRFLDSAGAMRARVEMVHVFVDSLSGKPVPIPDEAREKLF